MKRKFYGFQSKNYIDLSFVAYIGAGSKTVDVRDKNMSVLWRTEFDTIDEGNAYAQKLIRLIEDTTEDKRLEEEVRFLSFRVVAIGALIAFTNLL